VKSIWIALTLGSVATALAADNARPALHWYRGNMHTHTRFVPESDANETPAYVAQWFKSHGYQFVVITDHENLTDVRPLNAAHGKQGEFLVIQGQEVTQMVADPNHPGGVRHAHMNGINTQRLIMPIPPPVSPKGTEIAAYAAKTSMREAYERNLAEIRKAGGIPQINHPNLLWSVRLEDLLSLRSAYLMEVWNAFSTSNNLGGTDDAGHVSPSTEELWDDLLSAGKVVWATANDDSHTYHSFDDPGAPNPGRAWVVVHAPELSAGAITTALAHGEFYSSTGIRIADYQVRAGTISIQLEPLPEWSSSLAPSTRYVTRFIGSKGRVLATVTGLSPHYQIRGDEGYVRASIIDSDGRRAWTQPVFTDGRKVPE